MKKPNIRLVSGAILGLVTTILLGCADSPVYRLWYRKEWLADEEYGPTLHTRLEKLETVREQAEDLSEPEQARIAVDLTRRLSEETSPQFRAAIVRTLGTLSTPAAIDGLRLAQSDRETIVRIAACRGWALRGGPDAVHALAGIVSSDAELDVRLAATRGLGQVHDQAAIPALGLALDDPDPALQHRAVQSLRDVTGKDFGNSISAWRQYVRHGEVDGVDEISVADRLRNLF